MAESNDITEGTDEPDHIATLREQAEKAKQLEQDNATLRFAEGLRSAGLDPQHRTTKAWAATYEGEWDAEAVRSDFDSMFGAAASSSDAEAESKPESEPDYTTGMDADLRGLHGAGGVPPAGEAPASAIAKATAARDEVGRNAPEIQANEAFYESIFESAEAGDPSVLWTEEAQVAHSELARELRD